MSQNSERILNELVNHPDFKRWESADQDIIFRLCEAKVPINIMTYITKVFSQRVRKDDLESLESFMFQKGLPGIILHQIRYQSKNDDWCTKTEWCMWQTRDIFQKKTVILGECKWVFRPLNIFCRNGEGIPISKMLTYSYKMDVEIIDRNSRECVTYSAYIQTDLNGNILKKVYLCGDKEKVFPIKFAFPKKVVSQINQCLNDRFWNEFWIGSCYAAWFCTDTGIAYYLGHIKSLDEFNKSKELMKRFHQAYK